MTIPFYSVMILVFTLQGLEALHATYKKEQVMVEEGAGLLPISSYVFLVLKYFLRVSVAFIIGLIGIPQLMPVWLQFVLTYVVVLFIGLILEVIIRTLVVLIVNKKREREKNFHPDPEGQPESQVKSDSLDNGERKSR